MRGEGGDEGKRWEEIREENKRDGLG